MFILRIVHIALLICLGDYHVTGYTPTSFHSDNPDLEIERIQLMSQSGQHIRRRRSTSDESTTLKHSSSSHRRHRNNDDALLEFDAFKQFFHLNLTSDKSFIAPNFIVQKGDSSWIDFPHLEDSKRCMYVGTVNNDSSSYVLADLCSDKNSAAISFMYREHDYMIKADDEWNDGSHLISRRVRRSNPTIDTTSPSSYHKSKHQHKCATKTSGKNFRELYPKKNIDIHIDLQKNDNSSRPSKRVKRSESFNNTVELMIAADKKMVDYHGDGLEQYVLTLVAVASRIYKDESIGNMVNLILVKLHIFEGKDGPNITSDAQNSLNSFCEWQHKENVEENQPGHYDAAVLITREDICRSGGKCGTLGLAELSTICNEKRSCAIIEDNGLSSAFTIAHELGHVFGMPHDDSEHCTQTKVIGDEAYRTQEKSNPLNLMSSTLDYNIETWSWSNCSRQYITAFLEDENNRGCLKNQPPPSNFYKYQAKLSSHMQKNPGESYAKDYQCELVYGSGARICPYMPACTRLWCTLPDNLGCRTQHMPWADGTECADGKWCMRGRCVEKKARDEPGHGAWGEWQEWTECSRTCGGGVRISHRDCDNPRPKNGGDYCVGRRTRYESCNTNSCPATRPSFREVQCSAHDGNTYNIPDIPKDVKYTPHYPESSADQCKLYCQTSKEYKRARSNIFRLAEKVIDGTKCTRDGHDTCVNGICMPTGCDLVLGSGMKMDTCGVCGGDNSSCLLRTIVDYRYKHGQMKYGYNDVVTLPVNASSILITQKGSNDKDDDNYLAVRDKNGTYLFNGKYIVMMYGLEVKLANGATLEFSGSERSVETISIAASIAEELVVEVLSVGTLLPANVDFTYVVRENAKISFQWSIKDSWTECSDECRGIRSRKVTCTRDIDGLEVSDDKCTTSRPEVVQEQCNLQCDIRWKIEELNDCSTDCGNGFIRRNVFCVKQSESGIQLLPDSVCLKRDTKPSTVEACQGRCSPTLWRYSDWTNCSAVCGGGVQSRSAKCTLRVNGRYLPDIACNTKELQVSRQCNTQECTYYRLGEWSQCSATCGIGTQTREVVCLENGKPVDYTRCEGQKPENEKKCQVNACPYWEISDWTDCSSTCDKGFRYREVICMRGENRQKVDDDYCDEESRPSEYMECNLEPCPGWIVSAWSECSVTCGDGVMSRSVDCGDESGSIVSLQSCQLDTRPDETKPCEGLPQCIEPLHRAFSPFGRQIARADTYAWRYGGWTQCSATCGDGLRKRLVSCRDEENKEVDSSYCKSHDKPLSEQTCRLSSCGEWKTGSWNQCSVSCGEGTVSRAVGCALIDGTYGKESDCDMIRKPETEKPCQIAACPNDRDPTVALEPITQVVTSDNNKYWRVGAWTECSKRCGGGYKRRAVECYNGYSRGTGCDNASRPPDQEDCNNEECPTWRTGGWTKCTAECGYGIQQRMVICQQYDGTPGEISLCQGDKPESEKPCVQKPCGIPRWNTSNWNKCSVSCGSGEMTRVVKCIDSANSSLVLEENFCSFISKPADKETCITASCTMWQTGEWSECSGPCSTQKITRKVWCATMSGKLVANELCQENQKPSESEPCQQEKCQYRWETSEWSECSKSCGDGMNTRTIRCVDLNNKEISSPYCASHPPPERMKSCNEAVCPEWVELPWDRCSVTCGYGKQSRLIECYNKTTDEKLPSSMCDQSTKPVELTICQADPCPQWRALDWNKCTEPCNDSESIQSREVACISDNSKVLSDDRCDMTTKPVNKRPCQDCTMWSPQEWSRCSVTCGVGIQVRNILCVDKSGRSLHGSECKEELRPRITQRCEIQSCTSWTASEWTDCSETCGEGYKTRNVECVDDTSKLPVSLDLCEQEERPMNRASCTISEFCPLWAASQWTECSTKCGEGYQKRDLICYNSITMLPAWPSFCEMVEKPETLITCLGPPCIEWKVGKWSQCSVSCGDGIRTRNVTCVGGNDDLCDPEAKPEEEEPCVQPECASGFVWKTDQWSECSATCGYGVKSRSVRCYSERSNKLVPSYFCATKDRPRTQRKCQLKPCPFAWSADSWSQCSTSCGEGRQFRKVLCKSVSPEGWYQGNSAFECDVNSKPAAIRSCNFGPCYSKFVWKPLDWSECSADCGWGRQKRKVICVSLSNGERVPRKRCNLVYKPERIQKCYKGSCFSKTCAELRHVSSIREDGDYNLLIQNKLVKIYCHRMNSKEPVEYISLVAGTSDNFAIVYGPRLSNPYTCPYLSNSIDTSCVDCVSKEYEKAGDTAFTKVRIDVHNLTIIGSDFTFSDTRRGARVEYGTAGDCYSALDCPQGMFSIDLSGTGFRVSDSVKWQRNGPRSHQDIRVYKDGESIRGRCGGYCGMCNPYAGAGLKLELMDSS